VGLFTTFLNSSRLQGQKTTIQHHAHILWLYWHQRGAAAPLLWHLHWNIWAWSLIVLVWPWSPNWFKNPVNKLTTFLFYIFYTNYLSPFLWRLTATGRRLVARLQHRSRWPISSSTQSDFREAACLAAEANAVQGQVHKYKDRLMRSSSNTSAYIYIYIYIYYILYADIYIYTHVSIYVNTL